MKTGDYSQQHHWLIMTRNVWIHTILLLSVINPSVFCNGNDACNEESTTRRFLSCNNEPLPYIPMTPAAKDDWPQYPKTPIPYSVPTTPTQFTTLSNGGQYLPNTNIVLQCLIQCSKCPKIFWSFINGTVITATNDQFIINRTTLTVLKFDASQEGLYVCYTDEGNYSIISYPMELKLPRFTHWSSLVYDTPTIIQNNQDVHVNVSPNDAIILECTVAGNYPPSSVDWSPPPDNQLTIKLPNGNLLIKSFINDTVGAYLCTNLIESDHEQYLIYNIHVENDQQGPPVFIATPRSQVVSMGTNVTLYCLAHSNSTVHYYWYHGNGELLQNATSITPQIVIIDEITESDSYVCVCSNQYGNVTATANITVINKSSPIISVLPTSTQFTITNHDIIVKQSYDIQLILSCMGNHTHPSDDHTHNTSIQWVYRGNYTTSNNQLNITGATLDDVIGTVQCFIINTLLNITGITQIRLLKDKCNPPNNIRATPASTIPTLSLNWTPPTFDTGYTYQIEVLVYNTNNYYVYKVNTTQTCIEVNMKVEVYSSGNSWMTLNNIRIMAISHTGGQTSEYEYFPDVTVNQASIPDPLILTGIQAEQTSLINGHFNILITFNNLSTSYANNVNYKDKFNLCDDDMLSDFYQINYCCADINMVKCIPNTIIKYQSSPIQIPASCNSRCYWHIGLSISQNSRVIWADEQSINTSNIIPVIGGIINNITRIDAQGIQLTLTIELPFNNISCDPIALLVNCGRDIFPIKLADIEYNQINITLPKESCWDPLPVYYTYNNSMGMSPRSNQVVLPLPNKDDIGGLENIMYQQVNNTNIIINWTLAEGMECLITKRYITNITLSIGDNTEDHDCSLSKWTYMGTLHDMTVNNITIIINNNTLLTGEQCILIQYTINGHIVSVYDLMAASTNNRKQTGSTSTLYPLSTSTANSNINQIPTQVFLQYTLPTVIFVLLLVLSGFLLICLYVRKRKKHSQDHIIEEDTQKLLGPDGAVDDMKQSDTETVITKCEQLDEDLWIRTKEERMQSYLRDVEHYKDLDSSHSTSDRDGTIITAEICPPLEYDSDNKGKSDNDIPNLLLLDGRDCVAVQNAANNVFRLIDTDSYSHPSAIIGLNTTATNKAMSCDYERLELQDMNNTNRYNDDIPLQDLSELLLDDYTDHDITIPSTILTPVTTTLTTKLEPTASQLYTSQYSYSPHIPSSPHISLPSQYDSSVTQGPVTSLNRSINNQPLLTANGTQQYSDWSTSRYSTTLMEDQTGYITTASPTSITTGQTGITTGQTGITTGQTRSSTSNEGYIHCEDTLDTHPFSADGYTSISPPLRSSSTSGYTSLPPFQSSSTNRHTSRSPPLRSSSTSDHTSLPPFQSSSTNGYISLPPSLRLSSTSDHTSLPPLRSSSPNGHTSRSPPFQSSSISGHTSRPPPLRSSSTNGHTSRPPPLRSPSQISSGISSPKSIGSMESVFGEYTVGMTDSTHSNKRHLSDATSGISSPPSINSPNNADNNTFSFPLDHIISSAGYISDHHGNQRHSNSVQRPSLPNKLSSITDMIPSIRGLTSTEPQSTRPKYVIPSLLSSMNSPKPSLATDQYASDSDNQLTTIPTVSTVQTPELTRPVTHDSSDMSNNNIELTVSSCSDTDSYVESYSIDSITSSFEELAVSLSINELPTVQYNNYLIDNN